MVKDELKSAIFHIMNMLYHSASATSVLCDLGIVVKLFCFRSHQLKMNSVIFVLMYFS